MVSTGGIIGTVIIMTKFKLNLINKKFSKLEIDMQKLACLILGDFCFSKHWSMKRYLFILLLFISSYASGQVINFTKTLPVRAYSIGVAAAFNSDTHSAEFVLPEGGMSFSVFGGFGINTKRTLIAKAAEAYGKNWK